MLEEGQLNFFHHNKSFLIFCGENVDCMLTPFSFLFFCFFTGHYNPLRQRESCRFVEQHGLGCQAWQGERSCLVGGAQGLMLMRRVLL